MTTAEAREKFPLAKIGASAEIGDHAKIGASAEIGDHAVIGYRAEIGGLARIGDRAVIGYRAEIGDRAVIGGLAKIGDRAVIGYLARIGDHAVIGYLAKIGGLAKIGDLAVIGNLAEIGNHAVIGPNVVCEKSPPYIQCVPYPVYAYSPTEIGVGCIVHSIEYWMRNEDPEELTNHPECEPWSTYREAIRFVAKHNNLQWRYGTGGGEEK